MDCKQHEDLGAKPSFELTLQSRPEVTRWQQWGKQGSVRMHFEKPTGPGYGLEVAGKQKKNGLVCATNPVKDGEKGKLQCSLQHTTFETFMYQGLLIREPGNLLDTHRLPSVSDPDHYSKSS